MRKNQLYLLALVCLVVSCYSERKAKVQFSKAAIAYPEIPANYCATTFPSTVWFIKGDTVTNTDTIKLDGNVVTDTLISFDTVRIFVTKTLPGQTITKITFIHDTATVESSNSLAKIRACELERSKTLDLLTEANRKLTISQKRATARGIILYSLLGLVIILAIWKIYGLFKPKT